jgi:hypothetical protein
MEKVLILVLRWFMVSEHRCRDIFSVAFPIKSLYSSLLENEEKEKAHMKQLSCPLSSGASQLSKLCNDCLLQMFFSLGMKEVSRTPRVHLERNETPGSSLRTIGREPRKKRDPVLREGKMKLYDTSIKNVLHPL